MPGLSSSSKTIETSNEFMLANELNHFFCRFQSDGHYESCTNLVRSITPTGAELVTITVEEVRNAVQRNNRSKALRPDHSSALISKSFAWDLAPGWQPIFQQSVNTTHLILWYFSFLTNRVQPVKVNNTLSSPRITSVGVPQGSISSPVSFISDCTSDCTTTVPNQFLLKYSDDSTLLILFKRTDDPTLYQSSVWIGLCGGVIRMPLLLIQ